MILRNLVSHQNKLEADTGWDKNKRAFNLIPASLLITALSNQSIIKFDGKKYNNINDINEKNLDMLVGLKIIKE